MSTAKCDNCGWFGNMVDPITGVQLLEDTKHGVLCASYRTDKRLETGYYEQ